jgi:cardiolipin synthase
MNIVDQGPLATPGEVSAHRLPPSAGWRDVQVRLEGPAQARLAAAVDRLWRQKLRLPRRKALPWRVRRMLARSRENIYFFATRPGLRFRRPARVLVPIIDQAQTRITVAMAYFIPQGAVLKALLRARRRGVAVRVIVPEKSDVPLARWCSRYLYGLLLKRGIRLYERRNEMLHSKVLAIDDDWTVVGSCNLDPRSLRTNLEFLAVVRSAAFNRAVKQIFARDLRASRRVTWQDYAGRSWFQRALDRLAWFVRRWL